MGHPHGSTGHAGGPAQQAPGERDPLAAFLWRLSEAVGVSGHEEGVAALVALQLSGLADEVRTDRLGNCIALRRGQPATEDRRFSVMFAAHMDEIGMLVNGIEKGGFLRVAAVGGTNVQTLLGQRVVVHTDGGPLPGVIGLKPPHLTSEEERKKFPKWEELFVDCGLTEEEARQRIVVGDVITIAQSPQQLMQGRFAGKALDNRASVAALAEAMRHLHRLRHDADVFAVATVQEEVGLRGAAVGAFAVNPDVAVAIDVTFARQRLVSEEVVELGKGPAIATGPNFHPRIFERLVAAAKEHGVAYQVEVIPGRSGTDAWAIQVSQAGIPTGLVSVPLRYMHSPVEVVDLSDIRQTGRLLASFVAGLRREDVEALTRWEVGADEH
ncbi:MAG: M42 family metallopeptidase [Bacillota bacterium]